MNDKKQYVSPASEGYDEMVFTMPPSYISELMPPVALNANGLSNRQWRKHQETRKRKGRKI